MAQYQGSDDHGRLEERLAAFRQLQSEAPLACLERFEVLLAQATTCGLSLAPSQLERCYRLSLLPEYKRIANSIATEIITTPPGSRYSSIGNLSSLIRLS